MQDRVAVFIDNSNVFRNIHRLRRKCGEDGWTSLYDPAKLSRILAGKRALEKVCFYCAPPPAWLVDEGGASAERYATTMRYYAAVESLPLVEVKYGYLQGGKSRAVEKNVDTQLSVDMVMGAALDEYDVAILVSNDGDYTSAMAGVSKLGKKTELAFFRGFLSASLMSACGTIRRARSSWFQPLRI